MLGSFARIVAVALLVMARVGSASAQSPTTDVRVVTRVLPPMVMEQNGNLTGFSIDLWRAIADRLKLETHYEVAPDVTGLFDRIRDGTSDVGISALSVTSAREAEFDFSQPMFNSGLQIMVRGRDTADSSNPLQEILALLFSKTMLVWLGIAAILIIIPAHLVWFLELRHPSGIIPTRTYFPGIFQSMFWAASTLATQSEQMPRHWLSRAVAVLWMFTGVVFVAFYTAQLTATLTAQKIQGTINGPEDLAGKRVATTSGSTASVVVRGLNGVITEVTQISDAYAALNDNKVDAVVFDTPILLYYAANEGRNRVHVVGAPFHREDYGIVFKTDNPLQKRVNSALLALREDGTYQHIYDRWFAAK